MLTIVAKSVAATAFAFAGFVALTVPPDGCRLKVKNTGIPGSPNYAGTTCVGVCVPEDGGEAPACNSDNYAGTYTSYRCRCWNQESPTPHPGMNQGCWGALSNQSGSWVITCEREDCVATCVQSNLPGAGESVWACTCPDADG